MWLKDDGCPEALFEADDGCPEALFRHNGYRFHERLQ